MNKTVGHMLNEIRERKIMHGITYMWNLRGKKGQTQKRSVMVVVAWGMGGEVGYKKGTNFQL